MSIPFPWTMMRHPSYSDMLSNLPDNIIDTILARMPIQDVIRTSLISRKWRYKWVTVPVIVLDEHTAVGASKSKGSSLSIVDEEFMMNKLAKFVDRVLFHHNGSLLKFSLSVRSMRTFSNSSDIDQWIILLSRKNVVDFAIEIMEGEKHKLHSRVYYFGHLTCLKLRNCVIDPPPDFSGFKNLSSLELSKITVSDGVFQNFISSCPLLERLVLLQIYGLDHISIQSPALKVFFFSGTFKCLHFGISSVLEELGICLYKLLQNDRESKHEESVNLHQDVKFLSTVRILEARGEFLKFLAAGKVPRRLPIVLNQLSKVGLHAFHFDDVETVSCALLLIRSSPNLKDLHIRAYTNSATDTKHVVSFLVAENESSFHLSLVSIKLESVSGAKPEMEFIKLMLAHSPLLQTMRIEPKGKDQSCEGLTIAKDMLKDMLRFSRASTKAEIIYLEEND